MRHLVAAATFLLACSGCSGPTPDNKGPDASDNVPDGSVPTDGSVMDAPSDAGALGDPLPAIVALNQVAITTDAGTGGISFPSARFQRKNGANPLPCTQQTMGVCIVETCTQPSSKDPIDVSAGTINFTASLMPIAFKPAPMGFYGRPIVPWVVFKDGDTLSIAADGDPKGVPAFQASVPAPQSLLVSMPPGTNVARPVPRNVDFVAAWSQTNAPDDVVAGVGAPDGMGKDVAVICTVPRSAGTVTVPKELLQLLTPTPPMGNRGVYGVYSRRSTMTTAGPFSVEVRAGLFAIATTGEPIFGDAIIQ